MQQQPAESPTPATGGPHPALLGALGLATGLGLLVFVAHGWATVTFPGQVDYGEGGTMLASWRLAQGQTPYPDPNQAPYLINPYTPLYLLAGAAFMSGGPSLLPGRLVSLLACAGILLALALHLRGRAGALASLAGVAFFVVHPLVLGWSPLFRTDMLALFSETLGLVLAHRALRPEARGGTGAADGLATLAMVLAVFTKQSMLAGLAAWLVALGLHDRGRLWRALGLTGLLLGVPTLLLQSATNGWFLRVTIGMNVLPFFPELAILAACCYGITIPGLPILAAGCPPGRERLWWLFLAASLPMAAGIGRVGGFYNYYLELHLAMCAWRAWAGSWWQPGTAGSTGRRRGLVQILLCGGAPRWTLPVFPLQHLRAETVEVLSGKPPSWTARSRTALELRPWLQGHPGPILAENLANPALSGRVPWVVDPMLLFTLADSGRWDEGPVLDQVDRGGFALVVLQRLGPNLRFPPRIMLRILARYRVAGMAGNDYVLVPRPAPSAPGSGADGPADDHTGG